MKKVFTSILLLLFFAQVNYILTYYMFYKLNQDYLTDEKCEMIVDNCNACCYLNKKVTEQSEENNTSENKIITLNKLTEYNVSDAFTLSIFPEHISYFSIDIPFTNQQFTSDIFQPPRA